MSIITSQTMLHLFKDSARHFYQPAADHMRIMQNPCLQLSSVCRTRIKLLMQENCLLANVQPLKIWMMMLKPGQLNLPKK